MNTTNYTPNTIDTTKSGPTINLSDIDQICAQLSHIRHQYQVFTLCTIPFQHDGTIEHIDIMIDPIQDIMDPDMLYNTYTSHDINKYNFLFVQKNREKTNIITKDKQQYINTIKQHPQIEQMLKQARAGLFIHHTLPNHRPIESLGQLITHTAQLIRHSFKSGHKGENSHNGPSAIHITRDSSPFEGEHHKQHPIRPRILLAMEHQYNHQQQLHKSIINPLKRYRTKLTLDAKFLYMDNGNQLYTDMIHQSYYNDYLKQETKLLDLFGEQYGHTIEDKYIGLGVGNGSKDFHLLRYAPPHIQKIFIDSSMSAIQEAQILCKNSTDRAGVSGSTHASEAMFSQDRIDMFITPREETNGIKGFKIRGINVLQTTFDHPHPIKYNLASLHEGHTFRSIPGGTFGNFGSYKIQFLQQLDSIMQSGDHILISVFNKPKNADEITDIIAHYDTSQTYDFITNFLEKIGINKEYIQTHVTYEHDHIHIYAQINPPKQGIKVSCYGKASTIRKPTTITIVKSQRMDEQDISQHIKQSKTKLNIQDITTTPDSAMSLYLLQKT